MDNKNKLENTVVEIDESRVSDYVKIFDELSDSFSKNLSLEQTDNSSTLTVNEKIDDLIEAENDSRDEYHKNMGKDRMRWYEWAKELKELDKKMI